ncbi:MAG: XRE family transcriptional regulator [Clostridia bacterium]|nr:XRE family transcriptional regulator [Clostridia bacterium]NCD03645.1 XRE family transcriptional regulator [Clostridia bacterium]
MNTAIFFTDYIINYSIYFLEVVLVSKDIAFKNRDRFIELGLTIAALRKMQGMSQEQFAEKAGISRSHLSSIEAPNIARPFSLEVLYNIADALNINAGDLLNFTLPPTKTSKPSNI